MAFLKISKADLRNPEAELDALDYKYCLPKGFWTQMEWYRYIVKRKEIIAEIKKTLSRDEIELPNLEFK